MSPGEFRKYGHHLVEWLAAYQEHPERYPVLAKHEPGALIDALPTSGPEHPETMDHILADFESQLIPAITHWNNPGFMAYFATSASGPGVLAEFLAAGLNANGILWRTSPAVTELEQVTLGWLRQWMGLRDEWFGLIFDTASIGTLHAVLAARDAADPSYRLNGTGAPLTAYCSEHAHSSIDKAVMAAGIGQHNLRKIPSDTQFRMRTDLLAEALHTDVAAGRKPCCVIATVGTTSTTSIDPVREIAGICQRYGAWLHVDAAYAGSAAIVPELRWLLDGVEMADSLVTNPHKWLFTPLDLSITYTRRPEVFRQAFSLVPEYLRAQQDPRALNLMEYCIPLGRRFRALKLWFILRRYGHLELARMIRDQISWVEQLAQQIGDHADFELCAPAPLSVACLRYRGSDEQNRAILDKVNATGEIFLSHTVLNGQYVIRVAVGNQYTTQQHVERAWELIQAAAAHSE
jgi:aromatic-L-amino-acid decarboxylase